MGHMFDAGYCGVDIFFVLSGFLIYRTHAKDIGHPKQFRLFVVKRFTRIYPAYWLVFAFMTLAFYACKTCGIPEDHAWPSLLQGFLLLPHPRGVMPILRSAWTLIHELQFYAIFGIAILLPKRYARAMALAWVFSIVVCALAFSNVERTASPWMRVFLSRINLEFAAGCVGALLVELGVVRGRRAFVAFMLGAACLLRSIFAGWSDLSLESSRELCFGAPAALVIAGLACRETEPRRWMPKPLKVLGDVSYTLYLVQIPMGALFSYVALRTDLITILGTEASGNLSVVFCLLVAYALHRLVEQPVTRWTRGQIAKIQSGEARNPVKLAQRVPST